MEALDGRREEAVTWLRKAIELRPELRQWALQDSELEALRDEPFFRSLSDG